MKLKRVGHVNDIQPPALFISPMTATKNEGDLNQNITHVK